MSDKKNIDRLFQERFKDFEAIPDDQIWHSIHDNLHKKKARKIIPFYWKYSGIAAALLILLFYLNPFSIVFINEPAVVNGPKEKDNLKENKLNQPLKTSTGVVVETKDTSDTKKNETKYNPNNIKRIQPTKFILSSANSAVANNSNTITLKEIKDNSNRKVKDESSNKRSNQKNSVVIAENKGNFENQIFSNQSTIETAIAEENETVAKEASAAMLPETNPLNEFLKKKNEKQVKLYDTKINRWQVTTNIAPIYFNSASNGSPIESQFAQNSKSYENNLSIGIGVQYAINKKIALRTGVNKVTLGYNTNDVLFFGALNTSGSSNFSANSRTSDIKVISNSNIAELRPFSDNLQNTESGVLNQQMGYLEVPLEISYALIDRKLGVHVIGGISTLFLNENSVSVQSATTKMSLGRATNLNDIHFSSNLGIGFKYKIWKNLEANFEPTFKYQFNTFSRDSGNFKPYFIGLYTGINFKF